MNIRNAELEIIYTLESEIEPMTHEELTAYRTERARIWARRDHLWKYLESHKP